MTNRQRLFMFFTYSNDEWMIYYSTKFLRQKNFVDQSRDDKIIIIDDANSPLSTLAQSKLKEKPDVIYVQSSYNRNGNLIGNEHMIESLRLINKIIRKNNLDPSVIVKMDCDTLLFNDDFINRLIDENKYMSTGYFPGNSLCYAFGPCYAWNPQLINYLIEDLENAPAHFNSFEDYEMGMRTWRLSGFDGEKFARYMTNLNGGFITMNPRDYNKDILTLPTIRALSVGFGLKSGEEKDLAIKIMQTIVEPDSAELDNAMNKSSEETQLKIVEQPKQNVNYIPDTVVEEVKTSLTKKRLTKKTKKQETKK